MTLCPVEGDPLASNLGTPVGTLFAVYDVLDNDLGVRWLWPGKSGEFVPPINEYIVSAGSVPNKGDAGGGFVSVGAATTRSFSTYT